MDCRPGLEAPGRRDVDVTSDIRPAELDVKPAAGGGIGEAHAQVVVEGEAGDVDGVFKPFTGPDEADVVTPAGVAGYFDVDGGLGRYCPPSFWKVLS